MTQSPWTRRGVLKAGAAATLLPTAGALLGGCDEPEKDGEDSDVPLDTDAGGDTDVDSDPGLDTDPSDSDLDSDVDPLDTADDAPPTTAFDVDAIPADGDTFTYAVQAGAMGMQRAVLVTRAFGEASLLVRVWEPVTPGTIALAFEAPVTRADGGFVRVEATGLRPGRQHAYAFFTVDEAGEPVGRSDVGRFRTPPADDALPVLTVALCACNGDATGRDDAFGRIADHPEVDLVAHVGDMAYNDGATSLAEYRRSWQSWMTSSGYRAALASAGLYATWDDHEVDNDWNPQTTSSAQKAAAFQAFVENVAVEPGVDGRLWQSYRWGSTAEVFVLDCRSERRPSTRGGADDDVYVSRDQLDWLKAALLASPCRFKVVLNSVPITGMPNVWDVAAADRWEGYPKQRNELLAHLRDNAVRNVWFLSGDFHVCFVGKVQPGGTGVMADTWEIAVTSGNTNVLGELLQAPQFPFATSQPRLCLLKFDPAEDAVTVQFIDPADGQVRWTRKLQQP